PGVWPRDVRHRQGDGPVARVGRRSVAAAGRIAYGPEHVVGYQQRPVGYLPGRVVEHDPAADGLPVLPHVGAGGEDVAIDDHVLDDGGVAADAQGRRVQGVVRKVDGRLLVDVHRVVRDRPVEAAHRRIADAAAAGAVDHDAAAAAGDGVA